MINSKFSEWLMADEASNQPRDSMKSRWSLKYKRSIDCSSPKGFSQKNYCKRQNRGGRYNEFAQLHRHLCSPQLAEYLKLQKQQPLP